MIQTQTWMLPVDDVAKAVEQLELGRKSLMRLQVKLLNIAFEPQENGIVVHLHIKAATRVDINALSRKAITALAKRCGVPLEAVRMVGVETQPSGRNLTKATGRTPMTLPPSGGSDGS